MRILYILTFIFALPFLAVLGHDLYTSYYSEYIDLSNPVQFSDLGWLWLEYHKSSYQWAANYIDQDLWHNVIDPFLERKAILIALVPVILLVLAIIVVKVIAWAPWNTAVMMKRKKGGKSFSFRDDPDKKSTQMKYKRK